MSYALGKYSFVSSPNCTSGCHLSILPQIISLTFSVICQAGSYTSLTPWPQLLLGSREQVAPALRPPNMGPPVAVSCMATDPSKDKGLQDPTSQSPLAGSNFLSSNPTLSPSNLSTIFCCSEARCPSVPYCSFNPALTM